MKIVDSCLAPYIIKLESSAYQIYKQGKRKSSIDGTEKDSERFVASCKDLISACTYIATLKMETKKGVTIGLKDFLKEMRDIRREMLKITHDNLEERLNLIELKLNSKINHGSPRTIGDVLIESAGIVSNVLSSNRELEF